jgi:hypothetical protein
MEMKRILKDETTYCWNCGAWRPCKPVGAVKYKEKSGQIGYNTIHLCRWCRAARSRKNKSKCQIIREVDLDTLPLSYSLD